MITDQLRKLGAIPFDITVLQNIYPDCSCVCDKARRLVMQGDIIRLKKGMYVLSSMDIPLSKELIANHLYGPSYVSMNWALSYWGLIPERVHLVESLTTKHNRDFYTPIGSFSYKNCPDSYFPIGIRQRGDDETRFLIAGPEKALCDYICDNSVSFRSKKEALVFLEEDLRFEMDALRDMDPTIVEQCAYLRNKTLLFISKIIRNEHTV